MTDGLKGNFVLKKGVPRADDNLFFYGDLFKYTPNELTNLHSPGNTSFIVCGSSRDNPQVLLFLTNSIMITETQLPHNLPLVARLLWTYVTPTRSSSCPLVL